MRAPAGRAASLRRNRCLQQLDDLLNRRVAPAGPVGAAALELVVVALALGDRGGLLLFRGRAAELLGELARAGGAEDRRERLAHLLVGELWPLDPVGDVLVVLRVEHVDRDREELARSEERRVGKE